VGESRSWHALKGMWHYGEKACCTGYRTGGLNKRGTEGERSRTVPNAGRERLKELSQRVTMLMHSDGKKKKMRNQSSLRLTLGNRTTPFEKKSPVLMHRNQSGVHTERHG